MCAGGSTTTTPPELRPEHRLLQERQARMPGPGALARISVVGVEIEPDMEA
jgi:hypothetical protein